MFIEKGKNKIQFIADKVLIRGPKIDASYVVSFEVGEYMREFIKDLVVIQDKNLKVTVEVEDEKNSPT